MLIKNVKKISKYLVKLVKSKESSSASKNALASLCSIQYACVENAKNFREEGRRPQNMSDTKPSSHFPTFIYSSTCKLHFRFFTTRAVFMLI